MALVDGLYQKYGKDIKLIALGGATEASIWSNYYDCVGYKSVKVIPYGKPLYLQELYVVNPKTKFLCEENVVGEICIAGDGLAKGYLDEAQTEEAFVMSEQLHKRIYKTGDLGYFGSDGNIYIIGRVAQEIKHNGYRIDLKEIENFISSIDEVKMAVVMLDKMENNRTRLSAVVESDNRNIENVVREMLAQNFPYYMIPSHIIATKQIPLTNNGKVNKTEMLGWLDNQELEDEFTEEEKALLSVWKKVITEESYVPIKLRDNTYFDAGGQSLQAVDLQNEIKRVYTVDISLQDIVSHISLRSMNELIQRLKNDTKSYTVNKNKGCEIGDVHSIFDEQGRIYDHGHEYDKTIFVDKERIDEYKARVITRSIVTEEESEKVMLLEEDFAKEYRQRRSTRKFDEKRSICFNDLNKLLSVLTQTDLKYCYPSAGGLYPIDCYLSIKKNRVENIDGGTYYLNPTKKELVLLSKKIISSDAHYFSNTDIFNGSAFSIHLVFNANVSMPKYGGMAYNYAIIEAGIISELLTIQAEKVGIGSCIIGDMDSAKITDMLGLQSDHKYLLTIEYGYKSLEESHEKHGELVLIRKGTSDKNIVLIHAGSGEINNYLLPAQYLQEEYNVYAIRHIHDTSKIVPCNYDFEEIAKDYCKLLESLERVDLLGGWCIGGTIAYEISLLDPEKYKRLLFINTKAPIRGKVHFDGFTVETERDLIMQYGKFTDAVQHCENIDEIWTVVEKILENNGVRKVFVENLPSFFKRLLPTPEKLSAEALLYYINHFRSSEYARNHYVGKGMTASSILYLIAKDEPMEDYHYWSEFTNNYEERFIDGDHVSIFVEKSVKVWTGLINAYLDK